MSNTNDRDDIRAFLQEQFEIVEEDGGVSIVSLMHHAHTGPVELHSMKTGHAKWGNAEGMAQVFDAWAARHAKGVVGGGAQQYVLTVCRGGSNRPATELPFIRVGSMSITGPSGSIATEPPTELGLRQQAQRWGEQITQLTFAGMGGLLHSQQAAIDARDRRMNELETNNRELFIGLKMMIVEFDKMKHDTRMAELAAARAAEFQRQVMALSPALINMMAGRDIFPSALAESSLLDGLSAGATPEQVRAAGAFIAANVQNGDKLSAILVDHYNKYHEKMQRTAAEEKRLLRAVPGTYDTGEKDAAGEAMRLLTGEPPAPKPPEKGKLILKAVDEAGEMNGAANGTAHAQGEPSPAPAARDTALIERLFTQVPEGMLGALTSTLAANDPELAQMITERYAEAKKPVG